MPGGGGGGLSSLLKSHFGTHSQIVLYFIARMNRTTDNKHDAGWSWTIESFAFFSLFIF